MDDGIFLNFRKFQGQHQTIWETESIQFGMVLQKLPKRSLQQRWDVSNMKFHQIRWYHTHFPVWEDISGCNVYKYHQHNVLYVPLSRAQRRLCPSSSCALPFLIELSTSSKFVMISLSSTSSTFLCPRGLDVEPTSRRGISRSHTHLLTCVCALHELAYIVFLGLSVRWFRADSLPLNCASNLS